MISYKKTDQSDYKEQRVTTSDYRWLQVSQAMSDYEWLRKFTSQAIRKNMTYLQVTTSEARSDYE